MRKARKGENLRGDSPSLPGDSESASESKSLALGSPIISSTRWTAGSQLGTQAIRFGVSIVLARLLAPQDFGLMAMALVVVGFIDLFKDLGTGAAIVQMKDLSSEILSSLFYFNVVVGSTIGISIAASAPIIARVYGDGRLTSILQVLAITFIIHSFGLVKRAMLQRKMRFDSLAAVELTAALLNGATAILLGLRGLGVWALVGGALAGSATSTTLLWSREKWKPKLHFKWMEIKRIFHFSLNLTISQVFNYFIFNADSFIIGRFLGATPLGFYNLTQRLLMMPIKFVTQALTRVLFPAFSRIQDDNSQIQQKYLRVCGGIAFLVFPSLVGLCLVSRPFVLTIFGDKWLAITPLVMILGPAAIIQSLATTTGVIYLAKGRTDWLLGWQIFSGSIVTVSFICGLPYGITGVATAYCIAIILLTYPAFAIPFRLIDLRFMELVSALKPYTQATALMVLSVFLARLALEHLGLGPSPMLVICVGVGTLTYSSVIFLVRPPALSDIQQMLFFKGVVRPAVQ